MDAASALRVIERWANCRCVLMRAPMDPCRCVFYDGRWVCANPVQEPDERTPRDKADRRRRKK